MNKNKIILAATGGVIGLAVLGAAIFVWSALSARTAAIEGDDENGVEGRDSAWAKAQQLAHKPVYPCRASVNAINSNAAQVVAWQVAAEKQLVRGDRAVLPTTPAAFKTFIVADAKRLAALPGGADGVLAKPDFAFGPFKEYIVESKMPADADLARLQRQWDDVSLVVELLATNGIAELTGIQFAEQAKAEAEENDKAKAKSKAKAKGNAKAKAKGKAKNAAAEAEAAPELKPAPFTYTFAFRARPAAFVRAVNAFATCERFVVVDSFGFSREKDLVGAALGGDEKKKGAESGGSGRRRGRRGAAVRLEEKKDTASDEALKNGIVTDPALDPPLDVTITLTVYDFGSLTTDDKNEEVKE